MKNRTKQDASANLVGLLRGAMQRITRSNALTSFAEASTSTYKSTYRGKFYNNAGVINFGAYNDDSERA